MWNTQRKGGTFTIWKIYWEHYFEEQNGRGKCFLLHTLRVFDGVHIHIEGNALTSTSSCGSLHHHWTDKQSKWNLTCLRPDRKK